MLQHTEQERSTHHCLSALIGAVSSRSTHIDLASELALNLAERVLDRLLVPDVTAVSHGVDLSGLSLSVRDCHELRPTAS